MKAARGFKSLLLRHRKTSPPATCFLFLQGFEHERCRRVGDVCGRCRWQMQEALRSGSNTVNTSKLFAMFELMLQQSRHRREIPPSPQTVITTSFPNIFSYYTIALLKQYYKDCIIRMPPCLTTGHIKSRIKITS